MKERKIVYFVSTLRVLSALHNRRHRHNLIIYGNFNLSFFLFICILICCNFVRSTTVNADAVAMKNVLPVGFYCSLSIIEYNVQLSDETENEKQECIIKKNRALSVQ